MAVVGRDQYPIDRMAGGSNFLVTVSEDEIQRERKKAQELRRSQWWKRRRASGICHYCGVDAGASELTMDHIVPVIRGGQSTRGNVVPACKACNAEKSHRLGFEWEPKRPELRAIEARMRSTEPKLIDANPVRRAAVALILAPHEEGPRMLLIRRAEHPHDPWSGHMAFPGGRAEEDDLSLDATAVRETGEEVGVDLADYGQLITQLDEVPAYSGGRPVDMVVSPFFYVLDRVRDPKIDPVEVSAALWIPLSAFRDESNHGTTKIDSANFKADMPAFVIDSNVVWGLTYRMIESFLAAAYSETPGA